MSEWTNKYPGQTAWIIAKGPSLQNLKRTDIGAGPVITLNQAIMKIEELGLPNPVYSMQKDGGGKKPNTAQVFSSECPERGACADVCGDMVRPTKGATLLVHKHESLYCFEDYSPREVFGLEDFGLTANEFSAVIAILIAKEMGCSKINFVSFDSCTLNDSRVYVPGRGIVGDDPAYFAQKWRMVSFMSGIETDGITPKAEEA